MDGDEIKRIQKRSSAALKEGKGDANKKPRKESLKKSGKTSREKKDRKYSAQPNSNKLIKVNPNPKEEKDSKEKNKHHSTE